MVSPIENLIEIVNISSYRMKFPFFHSDVHKSDKKSDLAKNRFSVSDFKSAGSAYLSFSDPEWNLKPLKRTPVRTSTVLI